MTPKKLNCAKKQEIEKVKTLIKFNQGFFVTKHHYLLTFKRICKCHHLSSMSSIFLTSLAFHFSANNYSMNLYEKNQVLSSRVDTNK